ncbi:MAG: ABC transporter permease [Omnitrophica WOR_2 bacterium]|jgi:ABC-2 type transport system permease protein
MKQFSAFVKKEFAHVFRDRRTLLILFGMPVMQILIFGFALSNEIKNTQILIVDHSSDYSSRKLISKIDASNYFEVRNILQEDAEVQNILKKGKIKIVLIIPDQFDLDIAHTGKTKLQIIADASDPNTANQLVTYLSAIIQDFQLQFNGAATEQYKITPEIRMLYNPQLKSAHNFVPGVMALVLMLVCVMMTAITIVREKETGTMEVLLVSPFRPWLVMIAKAFPYLILSLINVTTIVILSIFVLKLPVNGSLILLFAESTLFIITCLTLGIFISIKTNSQQVAMFISLVGMLLPSLLFSGFMFPRENMPQILQWISDIIPARWYYVIVKSIMIKGLGFSAIYKETIALVVITTILFILSIKSFKQRLA